LWGPSLVSSTNNYFYYIFFVDAYSIFTWVFLLKRKSDALFIFQQLQSMIELQCNTKLKAVQTDCGGEFCPSHDYLPSHGINTKLYLLIHVIRMAPLKENVTLLTWTLLFSVKLVLQ